MEKFEKKWVENVLAPAYLATAVLLGKPFFKFLIFLLYCIAK